VSGAAIVLDDYGWRKHYEQKRAFDEFARQRGTSVLALPTGQGLILKP
jgi:O-methyltransferase